MSEIKDVQAVRVSSYGSYKDHMKDCDALMEIFRRNNAARNGGEVNWPAGYETSLYYMASKLLRLSADPSHEDSALDLASYAELWLRYGIRNED